MLLCYPPHNFWCPTHNNGVRFLKNKLLQDARRWLFEDLSVLQDSPGVLKHIRELLLFGTPSDWRQLARRGLYDLVAEIFKSSKDRVDSPDEPLTRAVSYVLALGFYFPRAEAFLLDLQRSQDILVGQNGFPAVSSGEIKSTYQHNPDSPLSYEIWGDLRPLFKAALEGEETIAFDESLPAFWRLGHLELIVPTLHPGALSSLSESLGFSKSALQAVLTGDAFLDKAGKPRLFPWYREEDEGYHKEAEKLAKELKVGLPEDFLDEPFESSWYLAKTGPEALNRLLVSRHSPWKSLDEAMVRVVPMLPPGDRLPQRMEGGQVRSGHKTHAYEILAGLNQHLSYWVGYSEGTTLRPEQLAPLQQALSDVLEIFGPEEDLSGISRPHRHCEHILQGSPLKSELDPYLRHQEPQAYMKLKALFFVGKDEMLLCFPALLVHMSTDGKVLGSYGSRGDVLHVTCSKLVLLSHMDKPHILDLTKGSWLDGVTVQSLIDKGVLEAHLFPDEPPQSFEDTGDDSHSWLWGIYSSDYRYLLQCSSERFGGVYRRVDGLQVADAHRFLEPLEAENYDEYDEDEGYYDEEQESKEDPSLYLLTEEEVSRLPRSDSSFSTTIGGITFTLLAGESITVDKRDTIAFALSDDKWLVQNAYGIWKGDACLARFASSMYLGAFSRDGDQLLLAGPEHIHLLQLDPVLSMQKHLSLGNLSLFFAGCLDALLSPSQRALLLATFGSVAGIANTTEQKLQDLLELSVESAKEVLALCQQESSRTIILNSQTPEENAR